jgi:hypothetical protein
MVAEGERCKADLQRLGLTFHDGTQTDDIATPVIVPDMHFGGLELKTRKRDKPPWIMDCHLARALVREVAPALLDMHVTTLRVGQIHRFRDVAGKPGVLSRHALGMAMDVYAFDTDDGVQHVVLTDYPKGDEVLLEIERRVTDTGAFRALLTPRNDPQHHYDHFHFEARAPGDKVWTQPVRERPDPDDDQVVVDLAQPSAPAAARELEGPPRPRRELEGPPRTLMATPHHGATKPTRRRDHHHRRHHHHRPRH